MLSDLLFPNRCLNCNIIIGKNDLVCENCFAKIKFTHHHFGEENLLKNHCRTLFPVENAFALMQFEEGSLSRKIVHQLKYNGREKVGEIIADWTTKKLDFENEKPDLIITVPLHPKKQKERGYNQLHLFAEKISNFYKIPLDNDLIQRNFYSAAQALKDKKHRLKTENMFSITKPISGKHILLIDDVFTTGNTVSTIAWEILKSGNNKVSVLVMAVD